MDALAKKKEREELAAAEDAAVTTQLNKKTGVGLVNNSFLPAAQRLGFKVVSFFVAQWKTCVLHSSYKRNCQKNLYFIGKRNLKGT